MNLYSLEAIEEMEWMVEAIEDVGLGRRHRRTLEEEGSAFPRTGRELRLESREPTGRERGLRQRTARNGKSPLVSLANFS